MVFITAHTCYGQTWAKLGAAKLSEWGIFDFPVWASGGHGSTKETYKAYAIGQVERRSMSKWKGKVFTLESPVCYARYRPDASSDLRRGMRSSLPWCSLLHQRSVSRLRANLILFSHWGGRRSNARRQRCIFCDVPTLSPTFHVLCRCSKWDGFRTSFWQAVNATRPEQMQQQVVFILREAPGSHAYLALLSWANGLDRAAATFWGGDSLQ